MSGVSQSGVSDEVVRRACDGYNIGAPDPETYNRSRSDQRTDMRAALEASGAVFLTDEERQALLEATGEAASIIKAMTPALRDKYMGTPFWAARQKLGGDDV